MPSGVLDRDRDPNLSITMQLPTRLANARDLISDICFIAPSVRNL